MECGVFQFKVSTQPPRHTTSTPITNPKKATHREEDVAGLVHELQERLHAVQRLRLGACRVCVRVRVCKRETKEE